MRILLALSVLVAVLALAESCTVACGNRRVRYTVSCGFWGLRRCTKYRTVPKRCLCPAVDGKWTQWSNWRAITNCTVSCGGGKKNMTRERSCTNPAPQYGGQYCTGLAVEEREDDCNTAECPIDGKWTQWSNWRAITNCTVFCGGGKKNMTRERSCTNPEPQHGGDNCTGHAVEEKEDACNEAKCGNLCPDNTVTFFADNNNNRYYYHCVHGDNSTKTKAYLMKCSDGTVWNQAGKACVLNTDTTSSTSTTEGCVNGAQIAHATDCSKFMQCVHGAYVEFSCSAGLQYNEAFSVCDWPANVNCQTVQP